MADAPFSAESTPPEAKSDYEFADEILDQAKLMHGSGTTFELGAVGRIIKHRGILEDLITNARRELAYDQVNNEIRKIEGENLPLTEAISKVLESNK